ncbi:NAD(P)-dependent alcohol dehydrogenase [Niveibacterium sp. SC-1]|uniref:zinc-dependent alcohol dehydrogenase family protein n=1 Tax=Niveibacterium sp. SC-1 TaxID=3135646 RepID=UPI00311F780F
MQSYHFQMGKGLDGIRLREHAVPRPGPGEVLLRMRAAALNYRELMILQQGRYPLPVKPDVIGLCDGAGEVVEVGAGVSRVAPGERVLASIFPFWQDGPFTAEVSPQLGGSLDGLLTEFALLPEQALLPVPAHLSWEEAACLPCAGVTAWHALQGGRPLQPGEDVLLLGSGGVSLFALQIAKTAGARVIVTTSSPAKAERLRALGADAVIDYRTTPEWAEAVRALTGGRGVQQVVEVGGATLAQSLRAVALGGEIALIGGVAQGPASIDVGAIFAAGAQVRTIAAGHRAHLAGLLRMFAHHGLRPLIDRVFDFAEAPAAFAYYAQYSQSQAMGKVIIRMP